MSGKLPGSVEQRLKAAQELLQRSKEKGEQSPNFTRIVITFRRETLINSLLHSQTQVQAELLTELMANNNVKVIEIKRIIIKRLDLQDSDSIQLFCRKRLITNVYSTVGELREASDEGPLEIEVTKMQSILNDQVCLFLAQIGWNCDRMHALADFISFSKLLEKYGQDLIARIYAKKNDRTIDSFVKDIKQNSIFSYLNLITNLPSKNYQAPFYHSLKCGSDLKFPILKDDLQYLKMDISKLRFVKQLFINGKFINSVRNQTFDLINPNDETVLTSVQRGTTEDIDLAVAAAREAFENGPWGRMDPTDRATILFRFADLIEKNVAELATIQAINVGKPVEIAKMLDVPLSARVYRYYGGWVDKIRGHTIPMDGPFNLSTRKEPVGVVGQIIPWNFPLVMQAWKLAPALAAGCTIVMKTAEQTPLSALRIAELINQAGFPAGVVNIVSGYGDIGAHLVRHPGVDKIAFTGSTEVGYDIMRNSHDTNLKRISLELGGKSPNIITKHANFETALSQSFGSLFFNAGQCCNAGSRTYVHSSLYDRYVQAITKISSKIKLGHSLGVDTEQGPLISQEQMNKVLGYIQIGKKEGATLMTGGKRWGSRGWHVQPTVFANVKDQHTIAKEEIFGPVKSILKFDEIEEVVQRANNTPYGLAAGVVTENHSEANYLVRKLRAGTVYVNCYGVSAPMTPFGGFKDSGIGRDNGEEAINNYLELKTIIEKI